VRLRYAYLVKCVSVEKDSNGDVIAVHCIYDPNTKSGTAGAEPARKVKGNIHWVSAAHAHKAEVRLYDRLFSVPQPGVGERNWLDDLNPNSKEVITAYLEPALANAKPEELFQFERHGYFVADGLDSKPGKPVFNRAVTLRESWTKT
jgi:glutaminyl-tRNA synthetase